MTSIIVFVAAALAIWASVGPFTAPTITVVEFDQDSEAVHANPGALAWANLDGDSCVITVWPEHVYHLDAALQQAIVTHEVGHCLGLMHVQGKGLMSWNPLMYPLSDVDRAEFFRVHPLPFRAYAPMVGNHSAAAQGGSRP